jgi:phage terminase large subunit-like protein
MSTGVASNIRSCAARSSVSLRSTRDQVLIENASPGMNLLQDLRAAMPRGMTCPIGVKPEGRKVDRMAAQSAKIEQHETGKPLHIKGLFGF